MAKKQIFTEDTLRAMGLVKNKDGSYSKAKSVQQPREYVAQGPIQRKTYLVQDKFEKDHIDDIKPNEEFRRISLVLLGEPMPKQSVRSTKTGHHFQPKKYLDREKDYRRQIAEQLPKDFNMFTEEVQIVKMHFIYAPLKGFQKIKGMMERIKSGELIKKTTKPDCDNLCKISFDSMSELVFKDDALICSIDGLRKYYGTGGCLIIEMIGK
jgi:Holliday junction resolvase RusA-like endonuclease